MSEFETEEAAAAYERWLAEKIEAARQDARARVLHEDSMARMRARLAAAPGTITRPNAGR
ncbi:antitoxin [Pseudoxanthomonas putridarboris]|uniref:Antitoxin n=1 Tax=Pseudoxanthomonas putridarboris TaxID=752605 RepID=A0ABU9J3U6_9GAMM